MRPSVAKLAQIGSRLVDAASATMADRFFSNVRGGSCGQVSTASRCAGRAAAESSRLLRNACGRSSRRLFWRPLMRLPAWTQDLAPRNRERWRPSKRAAAEPCSTLIGCCCGPSRWRAAGTCICAQIRSELALPPFLARSWRSVSVARLTGAQYEYHHHAARVAEGRCDRGAACGSG